MEFHNFDLNIPINEEENFEEILVSEEGHFEKFDLNESLPFDDTTLLLCVYTYLILFQYYI